MSASPETSARDDGPGGWLIFAFAVACGVTVANVYYAQPLVGSISESFGIGVDAGSFIVTMIQLGYVAGLLFLAPLGDLVENKRLILITLSALIACLLISTLAPNAGIFLASSLVLGISAVGTQMIIPMAAHLTPVHRRGQVVGTVVSGALFGILLSRPLATLIAGAFGWRAVYWSSALAMCAVLALMACVLPRRKPEHALTYPKLIHSLWDLLMSTPALQRRAAMQALFFGAFSLFWTSSPLLLEASPFSLGHLAMSAFLLSGVAGALIAPLAGRLADRGHSRAVTGVSIAAMGLSFVLTWIGGNTASVAAFVLAGIVLDAGSQAHLVVGQRAIFALAPEIRSRLNALYMGLFFFGGAIGSAVSGSAVSHGGATAVSLIGLGFTALAVVLFAAELAGKRK
ncbi:MAG: transporter [Tardiphaga sp.]|uniref:MFS transporter n=1 Tax=Tardiphaga sp. TaxID=1926292 RepID=UPI00260780AC|nr:MFS transporter [Tardiphaga sp.]MDB5503738.1 transporter [Tardiphaga sp.]